MVMKINVLTVLSKQKINQMMPYCIPPSLFFNLQWFLWNINMVSMKRHFVSMKWKESTIFLLLYVCINILSYNYIDFKFVPSV